VVSTPFIASYVVLWVLVVVLSIAIIALYSHFGQMYLGSREGRQTQGPEQEKSLRPYAGSLVSGGTLSLPIPNTPTVVVFAETHCKICSAMRPEFRQFALANDEVSLVVICGGASEDAIRTWAAEISSDVAVVLDQGQRQTARYGIGITPFAVAVGADGVVRAKGIVNDYDGLTYFAQLTSLSALDAAV
jgi:hypothetical protein